ncbi:hypothetical protein BELL_0112g00020 [Botrytis elliptica]|uniref:Uncharacterized protein n=1 Tax=Botrytis elliptica TaxID=278938 RepID=A0A4Z1JVY9_9HELO|nr:hypothetical protein BELL_0112g00020 [Botrytis elliptica]
MANANVPHSQVLSPLLWSQLLKLYFLVISLVPVTTSENIVQRSFQLFHGFFFAGTIYVHRARTKEAK